MTPTRNNAGIAHENGGIESAHGHLKRAIEDALLLRGSRDFDDLAGYRTFVDEPVGRRNARNHRRIDAQRNSPQSLQDHRTCPDENVTLRVTSTGSFRVRKRYITL